MTSERDVPDSDDAAARVNTVYVRDWTLIVVLFFSILANLFLGLEWMVSARYPWGDTSYDTAKRPIATYDYAPLHFHPYHSVTYDTDGAVSGEWFDDDTNGRNELAKFYSRGRLVETLRDTDGNDVFDVRDLSAADGAIIATVRDGDGDGYPELLRCETSTRRITLDMLRCQLETIPNSR